MFCKIVAPSADIHKLADVPKSFQDLKDVVLRKFKHEIPNKFVLKYKDSEEELITLCNDEDLFTAIQTSQSEQIKTLRIFVILDNKPDTNAEKKPESKQAQAPSQEKEKSQKPSPPQAKNDKFAPEAYGPGPEYGPADPGKGFEEIADMRRIYEQLPQMVDFRRTVSHNPQLDFERAGINMNNPRSFDTNELMDKVPFRMNSPAMPEQIVMSEFFNDGQIKAIIGLVEQKVREKVEEKLTNISGDLMNKFQDDSRVFARGNLPKAMGTPFGSRMFSRRNTNQIDDTQEKNCTVCNGQLDGIRYNCLNCKNFECCEKCESNIEHPHPLLKIRPSKGIDSLKQDANNVVDDMMPPIMEFGSRTSSRTMFQRTSSMAESNPQALTSEPAKNNESVNTLKRSQVVSTPGQNVGTKRTGTPGQTPNQYNIYEFGVGGKQQQQQQGNTVIYAPPYTHTPNHNNNPNMSQSQQTSHSKQTEKGEFKQYKVALIKPPLYEVTTVKAGMPYNISFTIKNNGDSEWPFDTKLICVEGNHKGEDIPLPALRPSQNYMVDLHLDAPSDYGRYFNEWKVHYSQNGTLKAFGKEIMIEIEVIQGDKTEKVKKDHKEKFPSSTGASSKSGLGEEDQRLMKEYNCTEEVLKHAKVIQDLMCSGTLKEKVDFMKECSQDWDLNQIVSAYLTWINNPNKLKNMNNQQQSTPSTE